RELANALSQQSATADILRIISRSTKDVRPAFDAILERALVLCDADHGSLFKVEEGALVLVATRGIGHISPVGGTMSFESGAGRAVREKRTIHLKDVQRELSWHAPELAEKFRELSIRTVVVAPLLR